MTQDKNSNLRIVYDTEQGRMCPECGKPVAQCVCRRPPRVAKGDGVVRIGRQTKGRKGKGVTTITGVPLPQDELKTLARELKSKCASGGAIKEGVIEIQGDHRDMLMAELKKRGWTVKISGG